MLRETTALQQAADVLVVRRNLRVSGIAATVFGLLALAAAIVPPADPILLGVGGVLTLTGLWNLANPMPLGLAFSAASLLIVGLYNVAGGFLAAAAGARPSVAWQVVGVWQVIWSVQGFGVFQRFRDAFGAPRDPGEEAEARRLLDDLKKANPKQSDDVIEFVSGSFQPQAARAKLMPEMVLCLIGGGDDVRVTSRQEFDVEVLKPGRTARVRVHLGGRTMTGRMPEGSVVRFQRWKQASPERLPLAA